MAGNKRFTVTIDSPVSGLVEREHYAEEERAALLQAWIGLYREELDSGAASPVITSTLTYNPAQRVLLAAQTGGGNYTMTVIAEAED